MLEPEPSAKWAGCRSAREKEIQARNAAETERDRASAAEKVAKNDRAVAEATVKFLHDDLLAQADPLLEPDRDLKLRTLLDRAAATIARRYDAAPLVEASIRQLIGDIYECLRDDLRGFDGLEKSTSSSLTSTTRVVWSIQTVWLGWK